MSAVAASLAPVLASSEETPDLSQDASKNQDTEMTTLLMDGISTTSSRPFSVKSKEMNPFQSAKDRVDRRNGFNVAPGPNPFSPTPWRPDQAAAAAVNGDYSDTQPLANITNRQRSNTMMGVDGAVPLSTVKPGPVWPSENQLKLAYAYGIRREDGTYTRLIPADELNNFELNKVPVTQGPEGMILLPPPMLACPEKRQVPEEMIPSSVVNSLPLNQPRRPRRSTTLDPFDDTQNHIDQIVAKSTSPTFTTTPTRRREKIYCDKWIHEGVCAFTQLGCKYKHEMPLDKATQMSLGLNHGLPVWYKRANGVQLRPEPQISPPSGRSTTSNSSWRNKTESPTTPSPAGVPLGLSGMKSSPAGRPTYARPSFGPIGPPRPPVTSSNPYSMLDSDMKNESGSEDGETVTWPGRKR